jgi:two-component sensor histidine kinase
MRWLAGFLSALVLLFAGVVLVFGWAMNIEVARHLAPSQPGMAATTAFGLLGCAFCLLLDVTLPRPSNRTLQAVLMAALVGVATVNLVLLAVQPGRGLDYFLFGFADARADIYMSPATSICLILAAASLLEPRRRGSLLNGDLFGLLVGAGLVVSVLALTGYAFNSDALHEVLAFAAMSLHTAISFFLVFVALLLSRPTWGWMRVIVGPGPGGAILRRTLPLVIVGPFVFSWFTLVAVDAGLINADFRLSILAIAAAACLAILLFWSALRANAAAKDLLASNHRLRQALSDRDILLKEVYHRVKNNLQFIDAMLALENSDGAEAGLAMRLSAIRARVHALGLVHQHLIGSPDLATLNLQAFLEELCANQAKGAGFDARSLRIESRIVPLEIHLDRAIPIGLVVTELLSNAAKHAFPEGRPGVIQVVAERVGENVLLLTVSDNGIGIREDFDVTAATTLGLQLVTLLVDQLAGELAVQHRDPTRFSVRFPLGRVEDMS